MTAKLDHEEPTGRRSSQMAHRPYGTGSMTQFKGGFKIRWRENEVGPDGKRKRVLRYARLMGVSKKEASDILAEKVALGRPGHASLHSRVLFAQIGDRWKTIILPMHKRSTVKNHEHIFEKHLRPRFGVRMVSEITREEIQAYITHLSTVAHDGIPYAPKTIDHIHDVLSSILRTAVSWGHLRENNARGVRLPKLKTVRPKIALTEKQAAVLIAKLPPLPMTLVLLDLVTGLRRGELFGLRWRNFDEEYKNLKIDQAVYEGQFDSPKTAAGVRAIPLSNETTDLLLKWKSSVRRSDSESLIFCTRSGKPISPNNILQRFVFPACIELGLPRVTWLTLRRTFSSWAHDKGVPQKVIAQLMGHEKVDTTLNVYTQVMDGSVRDAMSKFGNQLFTIVHKCSQPEETSGLNQLKEKAPQVGLEPTTLRLTAGCSAIELLRSNGTCGNKMPA